MNTTSNKTVQFEDSVKKSTKLIDEIVGDRKYHKKELLQPVIDAMDELIQLAEEKLK